MIYVVGQAPPSTLYQFGTFEQFLKWEAPLSWWELDVETIAADHWKDKKLCTVQFGHGDTQWVIEPFRLTPEQQKQLIAIFLQHHKLKLIHNAYFELVILLMYGIRMSNVYCTMLGEKILNTGDPLAGNSLADISERRLCIIMDKTEQTTFGQGPLTENQVVYAAVDVTHLRKIMIMQIMELKDLDLDWVAALEMDAVLSYAQITANGIGINVEKWLDNVSLAQPLVDKAKAELDEWLVKEPFEQYARLSGHISDKDRIHINWNSHQQKSALMTKVIPELPGTTKAILNKWCRENKEHPGWKAVMMAKDGDLSAFEHVLVNNFRGWLIDNGWLTPAGVSTINWNSRDQVLPLFQLVMPELAGLSTDDLAEFPHQISDSLSDYKDSLKLITSYGEDFLSKFVESDGQVRTSINQILETGRISTRQPNMQQIPAKETVGTRYRNCFICPPGWKFVDTDYASQELVVIAFLSKDPVWLKALENGEDLHSVCAALVFGDVWREGALDNCAFYAKREDGTVNHGKCKCPKHKSLRDRIKPINFGLAYGMSEYKLARTLKIPVAEAKALIVRYFNVFPRIGALLDYFGQFAVRNGYIMTVAPFYRKRWFPKWRFYRGAINFHLRKIKFNKTLGEIERAGKNTPIQGSSADIAKLSICMLRWYIEDNNLWDQVKLSQQVHDQNTTIAREEIAEWWAGEQHRIMVEAGRVVVTNGLLGAETNISEVWTK